MFGCTIFLDNVQLELEWDEDLEWFTRMSDMPFRVWDVLQEVVNNDDLSDGCEVSIRAFYVNSYIIFIFCNDPHTLADVVQEKTKEHIRRYNDQYCLEADELERYSKIVIPE